MSYDLLQLESPLRLIFFGVVLIIMALWEWLSPRRALTAPKSKRWGANLSISAINSLIVAIALPISAVGIALYAEQHQLGLFNTKLFAHSIVPIIASVIILDFVIYVQHVIFHAMPILWRVHRVHHVDFDLDVSTGIRFHPLEIVLSILVKFFIIILLGIPALAVLIFQIVLNATTLFNHSNVWLPSFLDKLLRKAIVTPDFHRVHHSVIPIETNSNYGFNLSIWDRLFRTYRPQPRDDHQHMKIGLQDLREKKYCFNLLSILWLPFLNKNKHKSASERE